MKLTLGRLAQNTRMWRLAVRALIVVTATAQTWEASGEVY